MDTKTHSDKTEIKTHKIIHWLVLMFIFFSIAVSQTALVEACDSLEPISQQAGSILISFIGVQLTAL